MNIEVPLSTKEEEYIFSKEDDIERNNCDKSQLLSVIENENNVRILDEQAPFGLVLFPDELRVRLIHIQRTIVATQVRTHRPIVNSDFVGIPLYRTRHRVYSAGGDYLSKELQSLRQLKSKVIRFTHFEKAKNNPEVKDEWDLYIHQALLKKVEIDIHLLDNSIHYDDLDTNGVKPNATDGIQLMNETGDAYQNVSVISGRIMSDKWIELLIQSEGRKPHRIILMWHATSGKLKRWHLSHNAGVMTPASNISRPSVIIDKGHGFISLASHMSDRDLLAMVMVHSGATTADNLCTLNQMDRCTIPIRALEASLVHRQLDTVSFYLASSLNVLEQWMSKKNQENHVSSLPSGDENILLNLSNVEKDVKDAVGLIMSYMNNLSKKNASTQNIQYCQQLAYMLNEFLVNMLNKIVIALTDTNKDTNQLKALAECIHLLYLQLKRFLNSKMALKQLKSMRTRQIEQCSCNETDTDTSHLYERWDRLAKSDVVIDGLQRNAVPIMVEYLLQRKEQVSANEIRNFGLRAVHTKLRNRKWLEANFLLVQMGLNVRDCLENILWETGSIITRNFLIEELTSRGMLSDELSGLWTKIEHLEDIYSVHNFDTYFEQREDNLLKSNENQCSIKRIFETIERRTSDCVPRYRSVDSPIYREEELDTEEVRNVEAKQNSRGVVAYHRFRLFALRTVSDETITRMLLDQSLNTNLDHYLKVASNSVIQYLLDYIDWSSLLPILTKEMAENIYNGDLTLNVPPYYHQLLVNFISKNFDLFENAIKESSEAKLICGLHSQPLTSILARQTDLITFIFDKVITIGSVVVLKSLLDAIDINLTENIELTDTIDKPVWAQLALAAVDSSKEVQLLSQKVCRVLLDAKKIIPAHDSETTINNQSASSHPQNLLASYTASLLMNGPIEANLAECGLPSKEASKVHFIYSNQLPCLKTASIKDLYFLLTGAVNLSVERVFGWQPNCSVSEDSISIPASKALYQPSRPNFSDSRLIERFGNRERLGFTYYLLQRRPSFAYISLALSSMSRYGCKGIRSEQRRREAVLWAHQLALEHFTDHSLAGACLAFVQLLSNDVSRLRCHLLCLRTIHGWRRATSHGESNEILQSMHDYVVTLTCSCGRISETDSHAGTAVTTNPEVDRLLLDYEKAVLWRHRDHLGKDKWLPDILLDWVQIFNFAQLHHVRLPGHLLQSLASCGDWLSLLVVAQLFPFQKADLRCTLSRFENIGLRDHMSRVIDKAVVITQNEGERPVPLMVTMAHQNPVNIKRDNRKVLYSALGVDIRDGGRGSSQQKSSFATATSESENTTHTSSVTSGQHALSPDASVVASSYDSRTSDTGHSQVPYSSSEEEYDAAKLMATVDALSNDSLFELLLTVRSPRALLAYSIALSHPLLAILSVCTATNENPQSRVLYDQFSYVCTYLIASLPYKVKDVYVESWGGSLKVSWSVDEAVDLFQQTLYRHSFQELAAAVHIFFIGNPMGHFFTYIRETLQTRNAVKRARTIQDFKTARQSWTRSLSMRGLRMEDNSEEEVNFTNRIISESISWFFTEVLRDLSAETLLTIAEELVDKELSQFFTHHTSTLIDRIRRLLNVLLIDCHINVDSSNFSLSDEGVIESCTTFALELVNKKQFSAARSLINTMDGPSAPIERLREAVDRAEAHECHRLQSTFSPKLSTALERVLRRKKDSEEELVNSKDGIPSVRRRSLSFFGQNIKSRRRGCSEVKDVSKELLFRPPKEPMWELRYSGKVDGKVEESLCREDVHRLLDAGQLSDACKISQNSENIATSSCEDLLFLVAAIGLACGDIQLSDLPAEMVRNMSERRVRPIAASKRILHVPTSRTRIDRPGNQGLLNSRDISTLPNRFPGSVSNLSSTPKTNVFQGSNQSGSVPRLTNPVSAPGQHRHSPNLTPSMQGSVGISRGIEVTRLLENLPLCLEHGKDLAERVYMMHKVAEAVDASYSLVVRSQPLSVLCKILAGTIVDKLTIADFYIRGRGPPLDYLNRFLLRVSVMLERHILLATMVPSGGDGMAAGIGATIGNAIICPPKLVSLIGLPPEVEDELALLARSLPTKVSTSTSLCAADLLKIAPQPLVLGELFLEALRRFISDGSTFVGNNTDTEYRLLVELAVLAEQCMELAGSTEGIAECLRMARRITNVLNNAGQYRALVRLLTGMRRFGEMNYVFAILLEKQHFEDLLSKEATKDNRLKIAIIEYLSRYRPDDKETFKMVKAYFSMTRENAETEVKKANSLIRRWCRMTGSSWTNALNSAAVNERRQSILDDAVQSLMFATDDYLRLQCQRYARKCFRKAQLCALQMSLSLKARVDDSRLLEGHQEIVTEWAISHGDFYETYIVCESIGIQPRPWVQCLWEQVVVRGDNRYLSKFVDYVSLSKTLIIELAMYLRRFGTSEASAGSSRQQLSQRRQQYIQNFRFILRLCEDVRLVNNLCQEFGIIRLQGS